MNRPIKVRVWDKELKKYLSNVASVSNLTQEGLLTNFDHPSGYIFQEFTGLLDKNGNELYEGDIVSQRSKRTFDAGYDERLYEIVWNEEETGWYGKWNDKLSVYPLAIYTGKFGPNSLEREGNIYENPELLKTT